MSHFPSLLKSPATAFTPGPCAKAAKSTPEVGTNGGRVTFPEASTMPFGVGLVSLLMA